MMQSSLLYQLHSHQSESGVDADPNKFEEVYRSKYGKVKIFKVLYIDERSKSWTSDPRNRKCDSFGSWLCKGQYPPAIEMVINQKQGFKSLKGPRDKEILNLGYQNQYIDNGSKPRRKLKNKMHKKQMKQVQDMNLDQVDIDSVNDQDQADIDSVSKMWQDSEATTNMWKLITTGEVIDLENILDAQPLLAHIRSSDGRGPMFWAFEYRRQDMVKVLMSRGVSHSVRDQSGLTPVDLLDSSPHQKR
jgi:dolichyl-diphosphooligosaccharide--protein glycosyltransferase